MLPCFTLTPYVLPPSGEVDIALVLDAEIA